MRYQDFKKPSDFKTSEEYQTYYRETVSPYFRGEGAAQSKILYDQQGKHYAESRLPTDDFGKQKLKDEGLLKSYRQSLHDAQTGIHGPDQRRIAVYSQLVVDLQVKLGTDAKQHRFEGSKEYLHLAAQRDAMLKLATDEESSNLISLAWDSFASTQDASTFVRETKEIVDRAATAENGRKIEAEFQRIKADCMRSRAEEAELIAGHATDVTIAAARGSNE